MVVGEVAGVTRFGAMGPRVTRKCGGGGAARVGLERYEPRRFGMHLQALSGSLFSPPCFVSSPNLCAGSPNLCVWSPKCMHPIAKIMRSISKFRCNFVMHRLAKFMLR
jgi:hypothetical protein